MTTMVWINVLLAVPFIALWAGIPLWLVLRRPDNRPRPAVATRRTSLRSRTVRARSHSARFLTEPAARSCSGTKMSPSTPSASTRIQRVKKSAIPASVPGYTEK